jgi:hypothetical protein
MATSAALLVAADFTRLKDRQGCPWWVAKELSDYSE